MMKKIVALAFICMLVVSTAACSSEEKSVVIASKPMTEQYIIVEMLAMLIEEKTDISVEKKLGIGGGTENIHPAMLKGEIDIYPEYTGTGWNDVLKQASVEDPQQLYQEVKAKYDSEFDITWSGLYGFNNTYGLALPQSLAEEMGITTYSQLAEKGSDLRFGAEFDFFEREDGYKGLESIYGIDFNEKTELDIGLKYQAIAEDEVDAINIFSTDGRLTEYDLIVLEDDKNYFPSYYAATLIRNETLEEYPELAEILELLTDTISTEDMTYMNYLVEIEKQDPAKVAKDFISEKGILN
ncbi:glycine betaine ABC transporter substrate-binding protein [Longirhabdus pacifica]|uniref:glycine betaine ABC transporter substrate-binding protein n=1 Tax=Longirhabdus pacifica TaxID=2305227 RepID=UPI001F0BCA5B|nr:glycine betaine ABC transporter substrate-binding protein [Longirhabdus pacifica]